MTENANSLDHAHDEHRDDEGAKLGMWLFIFTEILLFGGLFIVYAVYRFQNPEAFALAGAELEVKYGMINTIILLISSATVAMAISAIQQEKKKHALTLTGITIFLALAFLVIKWVFEWSVKIHHGLYPGSHELAELSGAYTLFFTLYFAMTGVHALHIIIGMIILIIAWVRVYQNKINSDKYVLLENGALYWHLVDLIWIFLFPLFYLIS